MQLTKSILLTQIKKWKQEIDALGVVQHSDYNKTGLQQLFDQLERLNAWVSRIDAIIGDLLLISSRVYDELSKLKEEFDAVVVEVIDKNGSSWVASGLSADERIRKAEGLACEQKMEVSKCRVMLKYVENFLQFLNERKSSLIRAKFDCAVSKDLLEMGLNLKEIQR